MNGNENLFIKAYLPKFMLLVVVVLFSFKFYSEIYTNVSVSIYEANFINFFDFPKEEGRVLSLYGPLTKIFSMIALKFNEKLDLSIGYITSIVYFIFSVIFSVLLYSKTKHNFVYVSLSFIFASYYLGNIFVNFQHGFDELIWLPFLLFIILYFSNYSKLNLINLFVLYIFLLQIKIIFLILVIPLTYYVYFHRNQQAIFSILTFSIIISVSFFFIINKFVGIDIDTYCDIFISSAKHPFQIFAILGFVKTLVFSLVPVVILILFNINTFTKMLSIKILLLLLSVLLIAFMQTIKVGGGVNAIFLFDIALIYIFFSNNHICFDSIYRKVFSFSIIIILPYIFYKSILQYRENIESITITNKFIEKFEGTMTYFHGGGNYKAFKLTKALQPPTAFLSEYDFQHTQKNRVIFTNTNNPTMFSARLENIAGPSYKKYFLSLMDSGYYENVILKKVSYLSDEIFFLKSYLLRHNYEVLSENNETIFIKKATK